MESQQGGFTNRATMSNGTNYLFWKARIKTYIQSLGVDAWELVEEYYQNPLVVITKDQNTEFTCNDKAMNAFFVGLPKSKLVKVMDYPTAKAIWDMMRNFYEGDNKVKKAKLQGFKMQFQSLRIHDDQDIAKYFLRVDEVMNTIKGLDEILEEVVVVQKALRYLLHIFNPMVSTIEEMTNLKYLTLDQLLGTLTTYEMRISNGNRTTKE